MKPALLIIDMQNWFFKIHFFSTAEGNKKLESLVLNTNELIRFFYKLKLPIFHIITEHSENGSTRDLWSKRNNSTVLTIGTSDVDELENLTFYSTDIKVKKTRHSAFIRTNLEELLINAKIDTLVITGYSTNACVGLTAIDSYEYDFDVLLAGDAILGPNPTRVGTMLKVLKNEFGLIPISNDVIMEKITLEYTK